VEYIIGVGLALGVSISMQLAGLDRDRALYPVMLIVIASYYDLFAILAGGGLVLSVETVVFLVFAGVSLIGFRTNLWIVATALLGHGVFDLIHGHLVANAGVPAWWPMFCMAYDVVAAGYLAWLLWSGRIQGQHPRSLSNSKQSSTLA
jgi:hypothetical protein